MSETLDESIANFLAAYQAAVWTKDVDAFVALFHPDARVFDLWTEWSYDGVAAWRAAVAEWFGSLGTDRDAVSFDDTQLLSSGDVAMVHAFITFTCTSAEGKALRAMNERVTWGLVRHDGAWKIKHQHTSSPIDGATWKVLIKRTKPDAL